MMSLDEFHKQHGINDFSRMSVYAWDFYTKMIKKEGNLNEHMENCMAVLRLAHQVKDDLSTVCESIKTDPYLDYLNHFWSEFFNNLPEIQYSEAELREFVEKTDTFIQTYKDLIVEV